MPKKAFNIKSYPKALTRTRDQIECNFIMALWQEPDSIEDYKSVVIYKDIVTDDGILYYGILQNLHRLGFEVFDNAAVETYLADKETIRKQFEKYGGTSTLNEMLDLINSDNLASYHDELLKNNMLLKLYDKGFDVVKDLDKFKHLTSEQVYDYYDTILNATCIDKTAHLNIENLSDGYEEYIAEWDSGRMMGYKIGFSMLNYRLAGIHKGNLLLHLAGIGQGKTTTAILFYILPAITEGNNVCIIANEQGVSEFRQMILSTVVFNKIHEKTTLNRQKFIHGGFTEQDKEVMRKGVEWLKNQKGKITFVETPDYTIGVVKKIVKKYSRMGHGLFIFDTLKPAVESSERAWAEFSEVAKELFILAKKEDVAIIATAQLSPEASHRKYLDLSCVGKSRAIAETATQVVMFRPVYESEKVGEKRLKPYNRKKDESGKYKNEKVIVDLDEDKDYVILFTPKNRFGDVGPPIIYERNMAFNTYKEVGFCEVEFDGFSNKR